RRRGPPSRDSAPSEVQARRMTRDDLSHTGRFDRRTLLRDGGVALGGVAGASLLASRLGGASTARADTTTPRAVVTTLTGAAIQQAINALPASGGVIELVAGTYAVSAPIVVPSDVQLVGSGRSVTILRLTNGANAVVVKNSNPATGNVDISIRSLSIDGNKAAQGSSGTAHGIELHKCA